MTRYCILSIFVAGCSISPEQIIPPDNNRTVQLVIKDSIIPAKPVIKINDSLNTLACLISGRYCDSTLTHWSCASKAYKEFSTGFDKRWRRFDSARISELKAFSLNELHGSVKHVKTVFYPFSGPDILYPSIFFSESDTFLLMGLEPVGTLPRFNTTSEDSLSAYYARIKNSLHAILNFSFFRTESMREDLRSDELNGVLHLLFLFINRTGNGIVSAKAFSLDSAGQLRYFPSFENLNTPGLTVQGAEIQFEDQNGHVRLLRYYSANLADFYLTRNTSLLHHLNRLGEVQTYLKGASYLLHKPGFSVIRSIILEKSSGVAQDDSGIALKYFLKDSNRWEFSNYGQYTKPIPMFARHFQPALDSLYKAGGARSLDFGIGYNYKGKKSNFMIAKKKQVI